MNTPELIRRKREGQAIPAEEIKAFVDAYVAGTIPDEQVSAFLMAVFFRGMMPEEAAALTRSMMQSGDTYDLSSITGPKVDKHSTGGVGDKVSLILAPVVAAAGGIVPMVSGRGLGHSGGTLDKLDTIPGYRWDLSEKQFKEQLSKIGCAIIGQTSNFVPADKKLYALRDVTATVESVPLICGSILSKKRAAGTDYLVMDVKCGSGAFMENVERARELARGLTEIGTALGMRVSSLITQMSQPLGITVGNALEVVESVELLRGEGPADAREVTVELCAEMLEIAGLAPSLDAARAKVNELLDNGKALEKAAQWIEAQGGNPRILEDTSLLKVSSEKVELTAPRGASIQSMNTREIGVAANTLGAGRFRKEDVVDGTVGLTVHKKPGDKVEKGEPVVVLYHNGGRGLEEARRILEKAIVYTDGPVERLPLIIDRIRG